MLPKTSIPRSSNFPNVKEIAKTFEKKYSSTKFDDNVNKSILHHDNKKLNNNTKINDHVVNIALNNNMEEIDSDDNYDEEEYESRITIKTDDFRTIDEYGNEYLRVDLDQFVYVSESEESQHVDNKSCLSNLDIERDGNKESDCDDDPEEVEALDKSSKIENNYNDEIDVSDDKNDLKPDLKIRYQPEISNLNQNESPVVLEKQPSNVYGKEQNLVLPEPEIDDCSVIDKIYIRNEMELEKLRKQAGRRIDELVTCEQLKERLGIFGDEDSQDVVGDGSSVNRNFLREPFDISGIDIDGMDPDRLRAMIKREVDKLAQCSPKELSEEPNSLVFDILLNLSRHPGAKVRAIIADVFPRLYSLDPEYAGGMCTMLMARFDPGIETRKLMDEYDTLRFEAEKLKRGQLGPDGLAALHRIDERKAEIALRMRKLANMPAVPDDFLPPIFAVAVVADESDSYCLTRAGSIVGQYLSSKELQYLSDMKLEELAKPNRVVSGMELTYLAGADKEKSVQFSGAVPLDLKDGTSGTYRIGEKVRDHITRSERDPSWATVFTVTDGGQDLYANVLLRGKTAVVIGNSGFGKEEDARRAQKDFMDRIRTRLNEVKSGKDPVLGEIEPLTIPGDILGNDLVGGNSVLGVWLKEFIGNNSVALRAKKSAREIAGIFSREISGIDDRLKKRKNIYLRMGMIHDLFRRSMR